MGLMTDTDINKILCSKDECNNENGDNTIHIHPFKEKSLTPIGYDLRVGDLCNSSSSPKREKVPVKLVIKPGEYVLIRTKESIVMPRNRTVSAIILSKVSHVAKGLSNISLTIDSDWNEGRLLIGLYNSSKQKIILYRDEPFCTAIFFKNDSPATKISTIGRLNGRQDIIESFIEDAGKARKKEIAISLSQLLIIFLIFFPIGYLYLKEDPIWFIGFLTLGVVISRIVQDILKNI